MTDDQPAALQASTPPLAADPLRLQPEEAAAIRARADALAVALDAERDRERDLADADLARASASHLAANAVRLAADAFVRQGDGHAQTARKAADARDAAERLAVRVPELTAALSAAKAGVGLARFELAGVTGVARRNLRDRAMRHYEQAALRAAEALALLRAMSAKPGIGEDWAEFDAAAATIHIPALRSARESTVPVEDQHWKATLVGRESAILTKLIADASKRLDADMRRALAGE